MPYASRSDDNKKTRAESTVAEIYNRKSNMVSLEYIHDGDSQGSDAPN